MQPIWKGHVVFGLVSIPVSVVSARESHDLRFTTLHSACKSPLKHLRWCPECEVEVPSSEVVKGIETAGGYALFSEEDLAELANPVDHQVHIEAFVPLAQVDPLFFEKSYYLSAQAAGEKAYGLLRRALADSGRAALAKVTLRHQETPALIRVVGGCLTMHLLAYPDEIRPTSALNRGAAEVSDKELAMANLLVESMTTDFDPGALHDERKARLEAKLAAKQQQSAVVKPDNLAQVHDLMDLLTASVRETERPAKTFEAKRQKSA